MDDGLVAAVDGATARWWDLGRLTDGRLADPMDALGDPAFQFDRFDLAAVLLALEDLGFCTKGDGGPFAGSGVLAPGGALPGQTTGGGLAYTHPGAFGAFLLVEATRQLRGECDDRQVAGADVALAHGTGGVLSATSTVILGTEATL